MCTEVNVIRGTKVIECDTIAQLAAALGVTPDIVSNDPPECCLCNAHWSALGARKATDAEGWPWPEYIIERPNAEVRGDAPLHGAASLSTAGLEGGTGEKT